MYDELIAHKSRKVRRFLKIEGFNTDFTLKNFTKSFQAADAGFIADFKLRFQAELERWLERDEKHYDMWERKMTPAEKRVLVTKLFGGVYRQHKKELDPKSNDYNPKLPSSLRRFFEKTGNLVRVDGKDLEKITPQAVPDFCIAGSDESGCETPLSSDFEDSIHGLSSSGVSDSIHGSSWGSSGEDELSLEGGSDDDDLPEKASAKSGKQKRAEQRSQDRAILRKKFDEEQEAASKSKKSSQEAISKSKKPTNNKAINDHFKVAKASAPVAKSRAPHSPCGLSYVPQGAVAQISGHEPGQNFEDDPSEAVGRSIMRRWNDGTWNHEVVVGCSAVVYVGDSIDFRFDDQCFYKGKVALISGAIKIWGGRHVDKDLVAVHYQDGDKFAHVLTSDNFEHSSFTGDVGNWQFSDNHPKWKVALEKPEDRNYCTKNKSSEATHAFLRLEDFGDGSNHDENQNSWFFIDDRAFLRNQLEILHEIKFKTFLEKNELEVKMEPPSGWCGHHCGGTQLESYFSDMDCAGFFSKELMLLHSFVVFLVKALREGTHDFASARMLESALCSQEKQVPITVQDSDDDSKPSGLTRRKVGAFETWKTNIERRATTIESALSSHGQKTLPSSSGAWFDADYDLRAIARAIKIECVLVSRGRLEAQVYLPDCTVRTVPLDQVRTQVGGMVIIFNGTNHFDSVLPKKKERGKELGAAEN
jgi:hypothetical protein